MLIGILGELLLRALFAVTALSVIVHIGAIWTGRSVWRRLSRVSMAVQFACVALSSVGLLYLLITTNLNFSYVVDYTSRGLPLVYRIAAFWGGDAGSLLFWSLVLTLYGMVVSFSRHEDSDRMLPVVSLIVTLVTLFYVIVMNVGANPFDRLPHPAAMGNGLNPLLQNPGMTVHPVNVYLGYIGFTIPFAYAVAGLVLNKTDATWLRVTRRWTLVSWLFLGIGIIYGAHWSYEELGWGGYWAWDPVENAALLPWLTATAFLHSSIVQERKGMLKAWNVVLVTLTYFLSLLGTYLVRSGVLWSIHAFANGTLGQYYLTFMAIIFVFTVTLIILRWPALRAERQFEAVVSKESAFMLNNVLFLGATFAILWGTVFPIVSEAVTGHQMMVSAPFYNAVNLPLAVCIILLMAIGPFVAWRRSSLAKVLKSIWLPLVIAVVLGLGATLWLSKMYTAPTTLATTGLIAAFFAVLTVVFEYVESIRARMVLTEEGWLVCFLRLLDRNRRRFGGYIVHLALAVIALGIVGSGSYHIQNQQIMSVGDTATIGSYQAKFVGMGVSQGAGGETRTMYANLIVSRGGHTIGVLRPSATFYENGDSPTTNVALFSRPMRDLYVVMLGTAPGNKAIFDLHVNPMVQFIWYGAYLFILGTLVSLWPERKPAKRRAEVGVFVDNLYEDLADLEYDHRMGKVDEADYKRQKAELQQKITEAEETRRTMLERMERELAEETRKLPGTKATGGASS
ncbi:cytochrome c-type biogenesis CcmF C-terminal domain-containing protein [Alicyclobacillus ferrooxydans]|uniref:cytochrome c-type biogenesis CcmF C-terminal domain-containing protein n=1 Tax=Alicyclobacillus ferrooxydans TaxID=471514 RepID=UPI0006D5719E|nr:cytochrome c-type biogenesis CcmF C-terminal domain-containing protein [Alicyclobacillus ferrooxydans]